MREEEKKQPSQKFFKKRWAYPAIYLASAAIIITAILWYQSAGNDVAEDQSDFGYEEDVPTGNEFDRPAVEVNRTMENFVMPVADENEAVVVKEFYDVNASEEEQEAALVVYDNQYHPNQGIDISMGGKDFDVLAAMSGTVTKVQEDSLLGNMIEIEHDKGVVTRYQSVKDFSVAVGDTVEQGQKLASASQSLFNEKAGVHVHFEIRKDDVAVNPRDYVNKSLATLLEVSFDEEQSGDDTQGSEDQEESQVPPAADSQSEDGSDSAEEENGTENTDSDDSADQGTDEGTEDNGSEEE